MFLLWEAPNWIHRKEEGAMVLQVQHGWVSSQ